MTHQGQGKVTNTRRLHVRNRSTAFPRRIIVGVAGRFHARMSVRNAGDQFPDYRSESCCYSEQSVTLL